MSGVEIGGIGGSKIEVGQTSRGPTYNVELGFQGADWRTVRNVITNALKARAILEHCLGLKTIPEGKKGKDVKTIEAQVDKVKAALDKKEAKTK
jgi:hypothetical protein